MLTREMEGAVVKCENYWCSSSYGPIRLKLLSTSAATPSASTECSVAGMGFLLPPKRASAATIKRVFELTNTRFPSSKPRIITHLQYLEWPDMNVPDDPRGILGLIKEVDAAIATSSPLAASDCTDICSTSVDDLVDSTTGVAQHALGKKSPVLLHCSAGVGRTGGFIAVDAMLDAVRRELKEKLAEAPSSGETLARVNEKDAMDVDPPVVGTIPLELATRRNNKGKQREAHKEDGGFIVHVPNAGWGVDSLKTPSHDHMVVDSRDEMETDISPTDSPSPDSVPSNNLWLTDRPKPSTRKWAEAVSNSTGMIGGGLRNPNANSSSSSITTPNTSSNINLPLPPPIVPIEAHAPNSRRKQSPAPTNSSSSIPSRHSSDSLGIGSIGADLPSSSIGTTMSNMSSQDRGLIRPFVPGGSQELLKGGVDFAKDQKVLQPSALDSPRSSEVVPTTNNTSNTSSTVGQPRPEFCQSPQPTVARSRIGAVTASSKDPTTKSTSPSSLPPPSSSLPSVSRSGSRSDFSREPVAQHRNFQSEPSGNPSGMGFRSVSPPISLLDGPYGVSAKSHLADTFSSDDNLSSVDNVQASIVDYKEPRPLHADRSPIALSKFEEPVWQIIHDMREQRMSLCQSLRQYVFVHAALIEGTLMIVDEQREFSGKGGTLGSSTVNADTGLSTGANTNPSSEINLIPSGGKRGASPTELLKKDRKGELSLAKRPSMKRKKSNTKNRTFDTAVGSLLPRSSAAGLP
jgi:tyrosine-protein phosphatase 2/3